MREFFRGWRRKAGCVTLVMACAFMMLLFRSHLITDFITTDASNDGYQIVATGGGHVVWARTRSDSPIVRLSWMSTTWNHRIFAFPDECQISARRTLLGAEFKTAHLESKTVVFWKVPYLWFILPLTLLSAYLLLWKPRK